MEASLQIMVFLDCPMEIQFVDDFGLIELLHEDNAQSGLSQKRSCWRPSQRILLSSLPGNFFCFFLQCSID